MEIALSPAVGFEEDIYPPAAVTAASASAPGVQNSKTGEAGSACVSAAAIRTAPEGGPPAPPPPLLLLLCWSVRRPRQSAAAWSSAAGSASGRAAAHTAARRKATRAASSCGIDWDEAPPANFSHASGIRAAAAEEEEEEVECVDDASVRHREVHVATSEERVRNKCALHALLPA
jgi:hypothetical protein